MISKLYHPLKRTCLLPHSSSKLTHRSATTTSLRNISVHRRFSSTSLSSFSDGSSSSKDNELALSLQSILKTRRTATCLTHALGNRLEEQQKLIQALQRAVVCAQMAPNHKRTEPFSFRQILHSSQSAQSVAEIAYQVAANTTSIPVAERKRQKWSEIPAFLVTLVHENQSAPICDHAEAYQALPYSPPETERQLEDYASASAATQNVLLSLHADGIGTKWATGPVIATPAFRELVQAEPTDRVAALIMVGGIGSTTFASDKQRKMTKFRRHRRRSLDGDLLTELP